MARMRSLRPDYFLREDMADVSLEAHFLLAGLAVLADRDGRLLDRPRTINAQVFPFREVDVEAALGELVRAGVVARYKAGGKACIALLTWDADQTPHPKETSLGLPPPPYSEDTATLHATPQPSRKVEQPSRNLGEPFGRDPLGLGVGVGSRDGSGSKMGPPASQGASAPDAGEDLPDATADAVECPPERPALVLAPSPPDVPEKPEKKQRQPSKAEALFGRLEADREEAAKGAGVAFVPEGWPPARVNKALGDVAKGDEATQERFAAAWDAYLSDGANARKDPPYSLGFFLASRSTWESRALKAAGGTT